MRPGTSKGRVAGAGRQGAWRGLACHRYGVHTYGMKKMTFTLDDASVRVLDRTAELLGAPKSQVVREALAMYGEQMGRLSEDERRRLLETFDRVLPALPDRPAAEVSQELASVARARRSGGRASPADLGS